eukprot:TRINITY_DN47541_c0_g1_i1.p1 TRINITY_DN47541_c0_g1~~TRINITY_DN47541_c0_g1_i1.p1  ORF type:complete len:1263 (+),score=275.36 TRINITY_DN47541_c0_g1_i1:85-3873(+)
MSVVQPPTNASPLRLRREYAAPFVVRSPRGLSALAPPLPQQTSGGSSSSTAAAVSSGEPTKQNLTWAAAPAVPSSPPPRTQAVGLTASRASLLFGFGDLQPPGGSPRGSPERAAVSSSSSSAQLPTTSPSSASSPRRVCRTEVLGQAVWSLDAAASLRATLPAKAAQTVLSAPSRPRASLPAAAVQQVSSLRDVQGREVGLAFRPTTSCEDGSRPFGRQKTAPSTSSSAGPFQEAAAAQCGIAAPADMQHEIASMHAMFDVPKLLEILQRPPTTYAAIPELNEEERKTMSSLALGVRRATQLLASDALDGHLFRFRLQASVAGLPQQAAETSKELSLPLSAQDSSAASTDCPPDSSRQASHAAASDSSPPLSSRFTTRRLQESGSSSQRLESPLKAAVERILSATKEGAGAILADAGNSKPAQHTRDAADEAAARTAEAAPCSSPPHCQASPSVDEAPGGELPGRVRGFSEESIDGDEEDERGDGLLLSSSPRSSGTDCDGDEGQPAQKRLGTESLAPGVSTLSGSCASLRGGSEASTRHPSDFGAWSDAASSPLVSSSSVSSQLPVQQERSAQTPGPAASNGRPPAVPPLTTERPVRLQSPLSKRSLAAASNSSPTADGRAVAPIRRRNTKDAPANVYSPRQRAAAAAGAGRALPAWMDLKSPFARDASTEKMRAQMAISPRQRGSPRRVGTDRPAEAPVVHRRPAQAIAERAESPTMMPRSIKSDPTDRAIAARRKLLPDSAGTSAVATPVGKTRNAVSPASMVRPLISPRAAARGMRRMVSNDMTPAAAMGPGGGGSSSSTAFPRTPPAAASSASTAAPTASAAPEGGRSPEARPVTTTPTGYNLNKFDPSRAGSALRLRRGREGCQRAVAAQFQALHANCVAGSVSAEGRSLSPSGSRKASQVHHALDFYATGKLIGRGGFGKVNVGVHKLTEELTAMKLCERRRVAEAKKCLRQEVSVLKRLNGHANVIQLFEVIETSQHVVLVMEFAAGGDLLKYVRQRRRLSEQCSQDFFRQLMEGIEYMHGLSVVHRDIKLENLLLDSFGCLKIADFGVAVMAAANTILSDQCGTPSYVAPEIVLEGGYEGFPVDIWSAGIVLYAMLCGRVPFKGDCLFELKRAIVSGQFELPAHVSAAPASMVCSLIVVDPRKRPTVGEALKHEWLEGVVNRIELMYGLVPLSASGEEAVSPWGMRGELLRKDDERAFKALFDTVTGFGFPEAFVAESVREGRLNHATATFHLLLQQAIRKRASASGHGARPT